LRIPAASEKIFLRAFETLAVVSLLFFAAVPSLFAQRDQTSAENQLVITRIEIIGNRRIAARHPARPHFFAARRRV
jgi:hypothetical protein